ncbi:MAG: biopolymer transporter ExbD [Phycisphaerales bacterium]|jgi:biopolymer transport protein ExbD|nr:biopolymer transporter ExbD [Phycisphaerales bacterium]
MIIKRRSAGSIGLNLTSMIDVVFLLLIYFMVATEFKTSEESFPMDLPSRNHGQHIILDKEPLIVHVESAGIEIDDLRIRLDGPWESVSSVSGLISFLKSNKVGSFRGSDLFSDVHPIIIKPTNQTRWDHTLAVYNAAAKAEFTNITFGEPL